MSVMERPHGAPIRRPLDPNQLATDHLNLVHSALRRHRAVYPVTMDDLESAGMLALVQASRRWNSERGVPFTAYARRRIDGAIIDEIRRVRYGLSHGEAEAQPVSTADHEGAGATTDRPKESTVPLLEQMTPKQRLIVHLRSQGFSTAEIAARLGVSPRAVRGSAHAGMWRAGIMPSRPHLLTASDLRILGLCARQVPPREQAAMLGKTYQSLKNQRTRILQKLGAKTVDDAVRQAHMLGLIADSGPLSLFDA